jgi:dipeptidyl aminopeptidase/acylaminoacyl peptidase
MKRLLAILFIAPALACSSLAAPTPPPTNPPLFTPVPNNTVPVPTLVPTPIPATATVAAVEPVDDVLAFIREDGSVALALIRDDGGPAAPEFEIVAPPEWAAITGIYEVEWSPEGSRLAMVGWVGPDSELSIFTAAVEVAADGVHSSEPINLGPGEHPAWSPDGEALLAVRDEQVMRTSWDVAEWEPITNEARWYGRAIYSPDPATLLVTSTGIGDAGASGNTTFLPEAVDVQTGERRALLELPVEEQIFGQLPDDLRLSPDGSQVAFTTYGHLSACQGYSALYTMSPDAQALQVVELPGASEIELGADDGFVIWEYDWNPAGPGLAASWLVVNCADNPDQQLVAAQISVVDGAADRVTIDGSHESLSFSSDGLALAAARRVSLDTSATPEIWWYDLANGEAGDVLIAPGRTPRFRP